MEGTDRRTATPTAPWAMQLQRCCLLLRSRYQRVCTKPQRYEQTTFAATKAAGFPSAVCSGGSLAVTASTLQLPPCTPPSRRPRPTCHIATNSHTHLHTRPPAPARAPPPAHPVCLPARPQGPSLKLQLGRHKQVRDRDPRPAHRRSHRRCRHNLKGRARLNNSALIVWIQREAS